MSNPLGLVEPGTPDPDFIDHLYGFEPIEPPSWVRLYLGAHADCWLSSFCRNPLHPGPCKGWKKTLAKIAPGAYNALEKDRVDKLNAKRKAKIEALKKEGKPVPSHLLKEIKPVPASEAAKGAPSGTGTEAPLTPKREAKIKAVSDKVKEEFDPETVAAKKAAAAKEKKAAAAKKAAATKAANKAKKEQEAKDAADAEAAAKGGMSSDDAQAYAEAMGAVVKLGLPKATKSGIKAGIAKTKAKAMDGPPGDDPLVKSTIDSMASKIASQAASGQYGAPSQAKLKEIAKQEIEEMLAAGSTEPPAGGLLAALKKYNEAPKGPEALAASDRLKEVSADIVHGPGTSAKAKKVAADYEDMAKAAGSPGLSSSFKDVAKNSVLANPKMAVSGGAMLQQAAADKVMKAAKAADPSLSQKQLDALGKSAKNLTALGLKPDGSGDTKPFKDLMAKDGATLAKMAKALEPDDAPAAGSGGSIPNVNKSKAYGAKANILAGKAGVALSPAAKKAAEDAALKDLEAGKIPGEPGSAYNDAMDLVASDMVTDLVAQAGVDLSLGEKLALSDKIAKVLRAASKQGAPTGAASAQLNAIGKLKPAELVAMAKKSASMDSTDEGSAAPGTDALPLPGSPDAMAKASLSGLAKAFADAYDGDSSKQQAQIMSPAMQKAMATELAKGPAAAKKTAAIMATGVAKAKVAKMIKEKGYSLTPEQKNGMASLLADQMADAIVAGKDPAAVPAWKILDSGAGGSVKDWADTGVKKHGGGEPDALKLGAAPAVPPVPAISTPSGPDPKAAKKADAKKAMKGLEKHAGSGSMSPSVTAAIDEAIDSGDMDKLDKSYELAAKIMVDDIVEETLKGPGIGLSLTPEQEKALRAKLVADYKEALHAGADIPGGLAGKLTSILDSAHDAGQQVASKNGWSNSSSSVVAYKQALIQADLDANMTNASPPMKTGNAGAGGSSPATPVTAPPAAKKAAKAAPISGTTTPVAGITHPGGQVQNDPQGIYPIGQVVVAGHEQQVADYNERVGESTQGKEALNVARQLPNIGAQATVGNHSGTSARNAVRRYSGSAYVGINGRLRDDEGSAAVGDSTDARTIRAMDSAFSESHLTEPITVLRGFSNPSLVFGSNWRPDSSMVGTEWRDPAYSSTTVNMATARSFAHAGYGNPQNSVVMRVYAPPGTPMIALGSDSLHPSEGEILLNRGARYRIVADNGYQNGARHLDVELILD